MGLSRISGRQIVWGYPLILMVEPTNICNLKCPMCPSGNGTMKRPLGKLDFEHYKRLIDDIGDYILQVQLWNQGEPFINKNFLQFVTYASRKGIMTQTSTNGHYIRSDEDAEKLIRSGLDQLIFSMDGTNKESYQSYRVGGNFDLVLQTLGRITRVKERLRSKIPLVELQFIIFKHNQHEIDEIIRLGKHFKLNRLSFKTAQVYSQEQALIYLPETPEYSRYNYDQTRHQMKGEIENWCKRLWLNSTVNWDGRVSPCCFDKDATYSFGQLSDVTPFGTLWNSPENREFRRRLVEDRNQIAMCRNCTEGLRIFH